MQLAARTRAGELPAGSGLSLGGGGAGAGKKREWRLYQKPPQKEAVPVDAGAPELLLLSHKINVLLNELQ